MDIESAMAKFDFQQVASHYDDLHLHSPEVSQAVGQYLVNQVGQGKRILEIGIGTGRIAAPVIAAGGEVVGIDISPGMLAVAMDRHIDQIALADMMQLPFADASFDAVLAVHVLHHASDWRLAMREIARVLRPGGLFIEGRDWSDPQSCSMRMRTKMREVIMSLSPGIRPPGVGAARQQFLARLGGVTAPEEPAASWHESVAPAAIIASMRARNDPETWAIDPQLLNDTLDQVEVWAAQEWPDLSIPQPYERRFVVGITQIDPARASAE